MKISIKSKDAKGQKALIMMKKSFVTIKTGSHLLPSGLIGRFSSSVNLFKRTKMKADKETPDIVEFEFEDSRANKKNMIKFAESFFSQMRVSKKSYEVIEVKE